jgi:predicted PurR-regulated permease PerM
MRDMSDDLSRIAKWVLIAVGIPAGLYLGKTFLAPLLIAIVLSLMLIPTMDWLQKKGLSKGFAVMGSTFILIFFFLFLIGLVTLQVNMLIKDWPSIEKQAFLLLDDLQNYIDQTIGIDPNEQLQRVKEMLLKMGSRGTAALGSISATIANFVLIIVYVVLLLSQRNRFKEFILLNVPLTEQGQARIALKEIRRTSGGYFWGMFKAMLILMVLYGAGFMIGGIKYALLLALIAAVFSFIPYLGNIIGGTLACLLAIVSGGLPSVAVVLIVMTLAQMVDNYITQPYVIGKEVDLNPFMTITSVIAFGLLWGVAGAIIAIPITGILKVTFQYLPDTKSLSFLMGNEKIREESVSQIVADDIEGEE